MLSGLVPQQQHLVPVAPGSRLVFLKQTPVAALSVDFGRHNVSSLRDLCISPWPPLQGDTKGLVPATPGQPRCLLELSCWVPLQASSGEGSTVGCPPQTVSPYPESPGSGERPSVSQCLPGSLCGEPSPWQDRSCRDPRESHFERGCSLPYLLGTPGRKRAGRVGGTSCLEAFIARVSPGPGLPWQMENAGGRKQSPWKEELSLVAASSP